MTAQLEIVTLPKSALLDLFIEALRSFEDERRNSAAADAQALSLNKAARLARKRTEDVLSAMRSGALPATGTKTASGKTRWATSAANVRAWVEAGYPAH